MGWFDDQISQRRLSDQEIMNDSLLHIASSVLGRRQGGQLIDERIITKTAIDDILKYYHKKPSVIPESITEPEEQMEYALRPHGLMWRTVNLDEGWYRDAYGPMLGFRNEDGAAMALLPKTFRGYYYRDPETGRTVSIDASNASLFEKEAFCFYHPLSLRKLGIRDLILFIRDSMDTSDCVTFFLLGLGVTLLGMLMTGLIRSLTGFVLDTGDMSLLGGTAVFLFSVILSTQLLAAARSLMMSRIGLRVSLDMESAVMMRIMNLPARFFREHSSGELSSRYGAIGRLCGLLLDQVFATGLGAVLSLLYIGQISHYAPGLAVYALLIILAGVLVSVFSGLAQIRVSREVMERSSREAGLSFSLINAVQKIRLAGAEKRAFARWAHAYADVAELTYNPPMLIRLSSVITGSISLAGTILLFYMAVRTGVSPSEYIAFNAAYGAVTAAFSALTGVALSAAGIGPVLDVAKPILETEPEISESRSMVTELSGSIELSNVWFRYTPNMPWVVNGMNLKIKAGEYVALVGTTGCGKSTLVRLLLGFETPDRGTVYYDGKDIRTLDVHSLRRRIGTVTQDGSLFQGSIFQNISISSPRMTLQDAWEAAEMAGLADDIRRMPMGMQTQISEGAGGISGGQKQRIMIARALAPKPQILIFDEATSALDNRTQQLVSEALDGLHCTRIVIAHRLSTIRNCSRILVLDQGRILEDGTYDELVAKNGFFAELIERQRLDVKTK